jgi:hypothetical protein
LLTKAFYYPSGFVFNYFVILIYLEKVIADRMADTAEEHDLLPQSQMGARKNRSTLSALTLLAATIKSAWAMRRDFVVSMLSLDISGAYYNVPHERLLHILRAKGFLE